MTRRHFFAVLAAAFAAPLAKRDRVTLTGGRLTRYTFWVWCTAKVPPGARPNVAFVRLRTLGEAVTAGPVGFTDVPLVSPKLVPLGE